jgi:hypothetical protein
LNSLRIALFAVATLGLALGFVVPFAGFPAWQTWIWGSAGALVLAALLREIVTSLLKGEVGLDIVAGISMSAALAFGETLAAAVVGLMYAGRQLLENFAATGRRATAALLARVPKPHFDMMTAINEVKIDAVQMVTGSSSSKATAFSRRRGEVWQGTAGHGGPDRQIGSGPADRDRRGGERRALPR